MRKFITILVLFLIFLVTTSGKVFATESSLRCTPTTGTFKVGDTFSVDYKLDTRTFPVLGAYISITYTSSILDVVGTSSTPITSVTNWSQPVSNTIDPTLGKIVLDYGKAQPIFTGNTSIGQITFKTKAVGQAEFNYHFFSPYDDTAPGVAAVWSKRDGTNISNILTDTNNCIYVVEGASPTSPPGPTSPPSQTTPIPTPKALPRSGTAETTVGLLAVAGVLLAFGGLLPVLLKRTDY